MYAVVSNSTGGAPESMIIVSKYQLIENPSRDIFVFNL